LSDRAALLEVRDLRVEFPGRGGRPIVAVDGVSLRVRAGETLGLVGESGSGKSTVGRAIVRLVSPKSGSIRFDGIDVSDAAGADLRRLRRETQMVFQDPGGSLNPRMRVWRIVSEPLVVHGLARDSGRRGLRRAAAEALERCGLSTSALDRYPHEFSGGQRQRIAIARALGSEPRLLVCDEPTSALDVSVQAQVLNLLRDLQAELGLAYLFISHDMGVIEHMSDWVAVMRSGRVVESGPRPRVLASPEGAYTRDLLASVPRVRVEA